MTTIDISICPTQLEFDNGDRYDEAALLDSIRTFARKRFGEVSVRCLQIGHRQGDEWATVNGDDDAGHDFVEQFFHFHGQDRNLFAATTTDTNS
jgi:hypothetical protein